MHNVVLINTMLALKCVIKHCSYVFKLYSTFGIVSCFGLIFFFEHVSGVIYFAFADTSVGKDLYIKSAGNTSATLSPC